MSSLRLILAGLKHHWRIHAAVALAVAACTAVLTGALLVGDSVRGSLRHLALDRLGPIDEVLVSQRFFREELATEVAGAVGFEDSFTAADPAVLLVATLENPDRELRAGQVTVLAWRTITPKKSKPGTPQFPPIVLNQPLADELGVVEDGEVVVRLPLVREIPADSPLGHKLDTVQAVRFSVAQIIPAEGLGRFGLHPSQQAPHVAFVNVKTLQDELEQPSKVNAIIVTGKPDALPSAEAHDRLQAALRPQLEDYGLAVRRITKQDGDRTVLDYFHLTSDRMMLDEPAEAAALEAFAGLAPQPAITYLAKP